MKTSSSIRRPELRTYRIAWMTVVVTTVLLCSLGTLVTLGVERAVVAATLMAGIGALYGVALGPMLSWVRRPALASAAVSGGATLVVVGVPGADRGAGLVPLAVFVATAPALVARVAARLAAGAPAFPASDATGLEGFDILLGSWDDDELTAAWYRSEAALREASRVADVARVVAVRQLYLDELERRSPETFGRWLSVQSLDR